MISYLPPHGTRRVAKRVLIHQVLFWGFLFCAVLQPARAQTAALTGFVTDERNAQPLELVNVVLFADGELLKGAVTNLDGLYLFAGIPPGLYVLEASFVGYESFTGTLNLDAGETRGLNFAL